MLAKPSPVIRINWISSTRRLRSTRSANSRSSSDAGSRRRNRASPGQIRMMIRGMVLAIVWDGNGCIMRSIVFGPLENPAPNVVAETVRQCLMSKRHPDLSPALDEYNEIAGVRLAWNHHWPEFGTLHQSVIAR